MFFFVSSSFKHRLSAFIYIFYLYYFIILVLNSSKGCMFLINFVPTLFQTSCTINIFSGNILQQCSSRCIYIQKGNFFTLFQMHIKTPELNFRGANNIVELLNMCHLVKKNLVYWDLRLHRTKLHINI